MYHVSFAFQCVYKCSDERSENGEGGREWRLPGLLYADELVLYGELEEDLKLMVKHFVEVHGTRGLKVNSNKSKVTVLMGRKDWNEIHMHIFIWRDWSKCQI